MACIITDPVLQGRNIPTLQYKNAPSQSDMPYLILAHYRDASNRHTSVPYRDGFRMANSAERSVFTDYCDFITTNVGQT